jgi:hypothetical protein
MNGEVESSSKENSDSCGETEVDRGRCSLCAMELESVDIHVSYANESERSRSHARLLPSVLTRDL